MTDFDNESADLAESLVMLTDTITEGFDAESYGRAAARLCARLLRADAVGLLLAFPWPPVRAFAGYPEDTLALLRPPGGPGHRCYESGRPVGVADVTARQRWSPAVAVAAEAGVRSVHALPIRLREEVIGSLSVFGASPGDLPVMAARVAQALADAIAIGMTHRRDVTHSVAVSSQLQTALETRVTIEQAKGMLAYRSGCSPDEAFQALRREARSTNRKLHDVARELIDTVPRSEGPPPERRSWLSRVTGTLGRLENLADLRAATPPREL